MGCDRRHTAKQTSTLISLIVMLIPQQTAVILRASATLSSVTSGWLLIAKFDVSWPSQMVHGLATSTTQLSALCHRHLGHRLLGCDPRGLAATLTTAVFSLRRGASCLALWH